MRWVQHSHRLRTCVHAQLLALRRFRAICYVIQFHAGHVEPLVNEYIHTPSSWPIEPGKYPLRSQWLGNPYKREAQATMTCGVYNADHLEIKKALAEFSLIRAALVVYHTFRDTAARGGSKARNVLVLMYP